jgi:hypothetical protein
MIIGYQAVGKRNFYTNSDTGYSEDLFVTNGIALNKYTASGTLRGECTASVYARLYSQSGTVCRPVLYTGINNYPDTKVSVNEGYYAVSSPQNYKWRTATFEIEGEIPGGAEIWFGFYADRFNPCFDLGSTHVIAYLGDDVSGIPGVFPAGAWKNKSEIQFSTYFEAEASLHYEIRLAQGVTPTDSGKQTARYKRAAATGAVAAVTAADYAGNVAAWFRAIREEAAAFGEAGRLGDYLRGLYAEAGSMAETRHGGEYCRAVKDTVGSMAVSLRRLFIFLRLAAVSLVRDYITGRFLKSKEEAVIKSPVCREVTIESSLH